MQNCIIVDIHKTLMNRDKSVNSKILSLMKLQQSYGDIIVLLSRDHSKQSKPELTNWLETHNIPYHELFVSPADMIDEKQVKVKEYILNQKIKGKYHVILAIDDKKSVRKMYEEHGIKTINPKDII